MMVRFLWYIIYLFKNVNFKLENYYLISKDWFLFVSYNVLKKTLLGVWSGVRYGLVFKLYSKDFIVWSKGIRVRGWNEMRLK